MAIGTKPAKRPSALALVNAAAVGMMVAGLCGAAMAQKDLRV
ncbi:MAG TPA: hypothetical protein VIN33_09370 [Marinobacter sp.]|jgi:hypothetical protein